MRHPIAWCGLVLCLLATPIAGAAYLGETIGSLVTQSHMVAGDVYVVDESRIRLKDFTYDGAGPAGYFYIGVEGTTSSPSAPDSDGTLLANENGGVAPLKAYDGADIVLTLPSQIKVNQIKWLSVWCLDFSVDFGHLVFPSSFDIPATRDIGEFSRLAHGVRSGQVTILDTKTFYIRDLHYDGAGPAAYFLVGSGATPNKGGTKVPDETGSVSRLKGYSGQTITITLPGDLTVHNIDWLSMYCIAATQDFGNVRMPTASFLVPPYLPMQGSQSMPLANCLHLHDHLNVAWQVMADVLVVELTGGLEADGGYMAFGISGSDTRSAMVGADVAVAYQNATSFTVKDYKLTQYSMCDGNGEGACPDTERSGTNDFSVLSGSTNNGVTTIRYTRQLSNSADADNDFEIFTDRSVYVVWALGKLTSTAPYHVTRHDIQQTSDVQINFGATQSTTGCDVVTARDLAPVTPWSDLYINGDETKTFDVKIGQAGGSRGYSGITGKQSWGIAYYINGKLIPELCLKRGETFTFKIEAGDDPDMSARYHPFYIAVDESGGYSKKTDAEKQALVVYAGVNGTGYPSPGAAGRYCEYEHRSIDVSENSETFDDFFASLTLRCEPGQAGTFTWTPNSDTEDLAYYQCWAHNYLGWKIHVVDSYADCPASAVTSLPSVTVLFLLCLAAMISI